MTATAPAVLLANISAPLDVQVRVGPFLARVRTELPGARTHLETFYSGRCAPAAGEGHFDLAVVGGDGHRRWVRKQALLVVNGARPFLPLPQPLAGPLIEWGMNWCIGRRMHCSIAVHAAVVERAGRAFVFPGVPGAGKSTLCAALTFSGWRLFSDEFALIDPDTGVIMPVPRPISLKDASIELIRGRHPAVICSREARDIENARFVHVKPPDESVRREAETAEPAFVIFPRYAAGSKTILDPVSKARALIELADQSFNYNFLGARGYKGLERVVRQSRCYRLEYSDLDDVLPLLARLTVD